MYFILAVLLGLVAVPVMAQDGCWQEARSLQIVGGGTSTDAPSPSCSTATNELGTRISITNTTIVATGDVLRCNYYVPDCSGKLYTVYLHHRTTGTDNAKVCVYTDDGDALPDIGDNLLVCSAVITGNANAVYYNAAMASNPLVATSTGYWVCLISDPATGWDSFNADTGLVQKYLAVGGSYAAPPATLDGVWGNNTSKALEAYVTVGD